jgi:hypothetical protein
VLEISCSEREVISGVQIARGASQAMSRVSERRVASRSAWKKELLFWSRRETGEQVLKVELARKKSKKSGQLWEVKLLPRDVSKGTGKGVVMIVADGAVVVCVVELADSEVKVAAKVEEGADESVAEAVEVDDSEVTSTTSTLDVVLLSACRFRIILGAVGGCRRSKCI